MLSKKPCCPWLLILFETALGAIFIYACYHKIVDPPDFAHMVYNYKITPGELINLVAIYLPWIELVAGLALITGIGSRGANALVTAMLIVFIAALSINLLRGHPVDCACFSGSTKEKTTAEMLSEMRTRVLQDAGMLIMALAALWMGPASRPWLPGWRKRACGESKGSAAAPCS
jgi:uncharacterized membrane protein YphA (DoxX/SURF4 family)